MMIMWLKSYTGNSIVRGGCLFAGAALFSWGAPDCDFSKVSLSDLLDPLPEMDRTIPTPAEVVGIEVGERHWYHHEIIEYLDALAEVSSRIQALGEHGRTYGGRPLSAYAISSPENLARLEEIRDARPALADPAAKMDRRRMPAVMHLGYSIHGDEPSGANASPLVAQYLAAARDPILGAQLEDVIILLNPVFNPDGLDRFAHWTNSHRGVVPSADPLDREHRQVFVTGRTNYYWFDLNRDWLPHQHPESRGRLELFHEWMPNVQLDFHEMTPNSTAFFQPGVPERVHPLTPARNQDLTDMIAEYYRRGFDADGTLYFSGERFDDFYMGKGSTYPDLFGCVGILFEQASSRGAYQQTENGLLTFGQSIANQFRMSLASLTATAALKTELLDYQKMAFAESLEAGKKRGGYYLASATGDPTRLREFIRVLQGHGIEVRQLVQEVEVGGETYPAGATIAVPLAQSRYIYLESLWERRTDFVENIFYDSSTWTLPLAFNLRYTRDPVTGVKTESLGESFPGGMVTETLGESPVGYLIDWRDWAAAPLLASLLEAEALVRVAMTPFTAMVEDGELLDFGYGTLLVSRGLAPEISPEVLSLLEEAAGLGLPVHSVTSSATTRGIDLGSRDFKVLRNPDVVLLTGPGFSQYQAGEIWHLFDQRLRMPLTMLDWARLDQADLREYTHVLVVGGSAGLHFLNEGAVEKLKAFVAGGGVLWTQGNAVDWAIERGLAEGVWREPGKETAEADEEPDDVGETAGDGVAKPKTERRAFSNARDDEAFNLVRGSIFSTEVDLSHPIGYGYASEYLPVYRNRNRFLEPSTNAYSTPVQYAADPLLSGYISTENLELASGSAGIVVDQQGQGAVVLAVDNPSVRAYWWGTQRLLVNAIFFGDLLECP
jgi:hypothetical protein